MKLWFDDIQVAPEGYVECNSLACAISRILDHRDSNREDLILMDIGESGESLLMWLSAMGYRYPIRIHTGVSDAVLLRMREIIRDNGWTEVPGGVEL